MFRGWPGDVDGDRDQDTTDQSTISNLAALNTPISSSSYKVEADINRDGVITSADSALASGVKLPLQLGRLSDVGNVFGFSGYVYNVETVRGLGSSVGGSGVYTIRFRHYDSGLGRWLQRDPAGYVDGMSLYEYVGGMPLGAMDPTGLETMWWKRNSKREWIRTTREGAAAEIRNRRDVKVTGPKSRGEARRLADEVWFDRKMHDVPRNKNWMNHYQHRNGRRGHVFYRYGAYGAVLASFGLVDAAEGASPRLFVLFDRLNSEHDYAAANMIAWNIAGELAALYGSGAILYHKAIMDAWDELRELRRFVQAEEVAGAITRNEAAAEAAQRDVESNVCDDD